MAHDAQHRRFGNGHQRLAAHHGRDDDASAGELGPVNQILRRFSAAGDVRRARGDDEIVETPVVDVLRDDNGRFFEMTTAGRSLNCVSSVEGIGSWQSTTSPRNIGEHLVVDVIVGADPFLIGQGLALRVEPGRLWLALNQEPYEVEHDGQLRFGQHRE
jgi:hypothetical protein